MKKFFLMLAVALPMFFMASCGDDNDDDVAIEYNMPILVKNSSNVLSISSNRVNLEWYEDMNDVKDAMKPFSYVLNSDISSSTSLAYTYDAEGAYPFYVYSFVGGKLNSSSITITEEQDEEIDIDAYLEGQGYKDITTDDDDDLIYRSKDKLTLVHYGFDGTVTVLWTPNTDTRANSRDILYKHLEVVKALAAQKNVK